MIETKSSLVLNNGAVYTVDNDQKWAQAIAIAGKRIVFIGSDEGVEKYINTNTQVIDLKGKMVLPAFVDSHMHPAPSAHLYQYQLNLFEVTGKDLVSAYLVAIKQFSESNSDDTWIIGGGYSRAAFDEIGPRKEWLDQIETERPIALTSSDGHSMWVNSAALDIAGITKETPQPQEGVIKHDPETGQPSGLLQEPGAMSLVTIKIPSPPKEQIKKSLIWLQTWLNAKGITTTHEAMLELNEPNVYNAYNELAGENKLTVRYRASWYITPDRNALEQIDQGVALSEKFSHPHFKVHSFKFFADHVIEEETGYLLEPYTHREDGWRGIKVWEDDTFKRAFEKIDSLGYQIHVHVIGDAAARYTLDALEYISNDNGERDSRHSFAHLQLIHKQDIHRLSDLGISVHTSPYWMNVDSYFWKLYLPYLGKERAFNHQYPLNSLFNAGVNVTIASDFWVTEPDLMSAFYYGMQRLIPQSVYELDYSENPDFRRVLDPDTVLAHGDLGVLPPLTERASLEKMIDASTINGAYANFLDKKIGSIEIGKLADLVVLEHNLFDMDIEQIPSNEVVMTFFEGKQVYSRD